jgi:hypothetical protein
MQWPVVVSAVLLLLGVVSVLTLLEQCSAHLKLEPLPHFPAMNLPATLQQLTVGPLTQPLGAEG